MKIGVFENFFFVFFFLNEFINHRLCNVINNRLYSLCLVKLSSKLLNYFRYFLRRSTILSPIFAKNLSKILFYFFFVDTLMSNIFINIFCNI